MGRSSGWLVAIVVGWEVFACGSTESDLGKGARGGMDTGGSVTGALCDPGFTRTCVGPGACEGGQFCQSDGTWSRCDCGSASSGEQPATGGMAASGGLPFALGGQAVVSLGGRATGGITTGGTGDGPCAPGNFCSGRSTYFVVDTVVCQCLNNAWGLCACMSTGGTGAGGRGTGGV